MRPQLLDERDGIGPHRGVGDQTSLRITLTGKDFGYSTDHAVHGKPLDPLFHRTLRHDAPFNRIAVRYRDAQPTELSFGMARERISAEERRIRILDAAVEVFAEQGYTAAKMQDIAARAGVVPSVLYDHFGSKRELHITLLRAPCRCSCGSAR